MENPALTYVFLVIPILFALAVLAQGLVKLSRKTPDGPVEVGLGTFLLVLIGAAWVLFIR